MPGGGDRRAMRARFRAGFGVGLGLSLGLALAAAQALGAPALPPLAGEAGEAGGTGPGWRVVTLPRQTLPVTRYAIEPVDGRPALRIEARASYGNLVHEPASSGAPRTLRWSWRLAQANPAANLRTREGDDSPVKVCLSFALPLERVPFVERQLLRLARARTGDELPAATLCWAWDAREPADTLLPNAYTRRVRTLVLRGAADAPGRWFDEVRDVAADFRRAFGDESAELPPLVAVIVAGDADNTGASSVAHVAGLRFAP